MYAIRSLLGNSSSLARNSDTRIRIRVPTPYQEYMPTKSKIYKNCVKKWQGFFSPATQQCIPNSDCQCWSFGRAVSLITDKNVKGSWNYSDGFHIKAQVDGEGYLQSTASHPLAVHSICPPPLNERPAPKGFAKKNKKPCPFPHIYTQLKYIHMYKRAQQSNFGHRKQQLQFDGWWSVIKIPRGFLRGKKRSLEISSNSTEIKTSLFLRDCEMKCWYIGFTCCYTMNTIIYM